jgi:hypothetical protein
MSTERIIIKRRNTDEPAHKFGAHRDRENYWHYSYGYGATETEALLALLAADEAAKPKPATVFATTIIEACGATWTASPLSMLGAAASTPIGATHWVSQQNNWPSSKAKPDLVGFYASSIEDACEKLAN